MHTTALRTELQGLLKSARAVRTDAMAALDALEDETHAHGPVMLNGSRNEELKQSMDGMRNDLETAIAALRRALQTADQIEDVAQRYTAEGIPHPVKAPAPKVPDKG